MVLCWGFKRIQHFLSPSVIVFKALSNTKRSLVVSIATAIEKREGRGGRGEFKQERVDVTGTFKPSFSVALGNQ